MLLLLLLVVVAVLHPAADRDEVAVEVSYVFRGDTLKDEWGIDDDDEEVEEDDGVGIDSGGV